MFNYEEQYEKAINIAANAHMNQKDKEGMDYILHPLTVCAYCHSPKAKIAALLHDVIEDAGYTKETLLQKGIDAEVVHIVDLLSKVPGQSEDEYYRRLMPNQLAREVKMGDLLHNMDLGRYKGVYTKTNVQQTIKYIHYFQKLYKEEQNYVSAQNE